MSMTPREYLSQVFRIEQRIKAKEIKSAEFESLAGSIPGPNYDGIKVDHTRRIDAPYVYWLEKKAEVDEQIRNLCARQSVLKGEIMTAIEKLENEEYQSLLVMRYFNFRTWEDVAYELSVSLATVKRWHTKALEEIGEKMNRNEPL